MFRIFAVLCALSSPAAAATFSGATLQYTHFDDGVQSRQNIFTVGPRTLIDTAPGYNVRVQDNVLTIRTGRSFAPKPGDFFTVADLFDSLPDIVDVEVRRDRRAPQVPVTFDTEEIRVLMGQSSSPTRNDFSLIVSFAESPAAVPLPASVALLVGGLAGLFGVKRRKDA